MNDLEFVFDDELISTPLSNLYQNGTISASEFLALMEGADETAVEDALLDLEMDGVSLDISGLPRGANSGEAALRLRREEQLVKQADFLSKLDENDPLRLYLEEIASIPACGDVQLLAQECSTGGDHSREKLLNLCLSRVVEQAKEMTGYGVLLLDLIQEGSLGLWQAICGYRSGDFETHCDWWIHQYMAKAVVLQARQNGVGGKMRQALEDYRAVDERLLSDLGRNATLEEIALELHMSVEETETVKKMLDSARLVNRAKAASEPEEEEPEEETQHVEDTAFFQMRQRISELLSGLPETDAKLLTLRFGLEGGLPLSPEETGRKLGLTPEEVVAKEAAALSQLRNG